MNTFPQLPWMDSEVMQRLVQREDLHVFGCLTLLAELASPDGKIAYSKAVTCLKATPDMNERKAATSISRLVDANWVIQTDKTL